ncbi:hypothetical protein M135_4288 [Bacteroides fragilis str. S36L5]|nr:hypothetical protein M074_1246 [Bacteroides fragilis str. DS-166]EYA89082.1 hypothetical protein M135_4288 [Bacteroides fragilis str. S36L5]EYB15422.1 hypothetical protein M140_1149 [Bacteroides fragilis str. S38L3]
MRKVQSGETCNLYISSTEIHPADDIGDIIISSSRLPS